MLTGIGIDMVEIGRIERILDRAGDRFLKRVCTDRELTRRDAREVAGRFAAKEALAKALGTGIGQVRFRDIEIIGGAAGAPRYELGPSIAAVAGRPLRAHLSITHDGGFAVAVAVLETP